MARAQTAFMARTAVPARDALQKALDALKLRLVLDDGYVPLESSGYLPCTLDGEDAGFTLRFRPAQEELSAQPALAAALATAGEVVAVEFKWSGDVREEVSAMGVCAALAGSFGAAVLDPAGSPLDAARLLARAKAGLDEL